MSELKAIIDFEQAAKDLSFSEADLSAQMQRQPGLFAHYGKIAADAQRQADVIKLQLKLKEASVEKKFREEAAENGQKVTEKVVASNVETDKGVITLQTNLIKANHIAAMARTTLEAMRHKRDMMEQNAFMMRDQIRSNVSVSGEQNNEQNGEKDVEDQQKRVRQKARQVTANKREKT